MKRLVLFFLYFVIIKKYICNSSWVSLKVGWIKMSEVTIEREAIIVELDMMLKENEKLISTYEELGVFELAYLIKWQIIEATLKNIAKTQRKENLLNKLNEWISYLGGASNAPKKINSFSIDSDSLPEIELIIAYFDKAALPNIKIVLSPKEKFRKKRNDLAHRFERFGKADTYYSYSKQLDRAINELKTLLLAD